MRHSYMLYSNNRNESIAFGDIEYICDHVNDYFHMSTVKPNLKSVLKTLNMQHDLMLMQVLSGRWAS
jgi:hypothetical protein